MSTRSLPMRSASAREAPPLVKANRNCATTATGQKPAPVRLRTSRAGSLWMRSHRPARRQRASTKTWPPWAVAWSELVIWMCSLVLRLVIAAIALSHHKGDILSTGFSPWDAFLLTRLTIRGLLVRIYVFFMVLAESEDGAV